MPASAARVTLQAPYLPPICPLGSRKRKEHNGRLFKTKFSCRRSPRRLCLTCISTSRPIAGQFPVPHLGHQRRDFPGLRPRLLRRFHEFGMNWIELRSMWGKNVTDLSDDQIAEAKKILAKYNLRVTDIASPLFKTDWPGAPKSPYGTKGDTCMARLTSTFKQQDEVLERCIALAKAIQHRTKCAASTSGGSTMSRPTAPPSTKSCARQRRSPASRAFCWCSKTSSSATLRPAAKPRAP